MYQTICSIEAIKYQTLSIHKRHKLKNENVYMSVLQQGKRQKLRK